MVPLGNITAAGWLSNEATWLSRAATGPASHSGPNACQPGRSPDALKQANPRSVATCYD